MDEPGPNELVMVGGLPELIKPLASALAQGLRRLCRDLAASADDVAAPRRAHELVDELQAPVGLLEDLTRLAADRVPDASDRLRARLAQASTQRALGRLTTALAETQRFMAYPSAHRRNMVTSAAELADLREAAAIVGGMARVLVTGVPPVIVIVTTVGESGWLGSKLRDRGAP